MSNWTPITRAALALATVAIAAQTATAAPQAAPQTAVAFSAPPAVPQGAPPCQHCQPHRRCPHHGGYDDYEPPDYPPPAPPSKYAPPVTKGSPQVPPKG